MIIQPATEPSNSIIFKVRGASDRCFFAYFCLKERDVQFPQIHPVTSNLDTLIKHTHGDLETFLGKGTFRNESVDDCTFQSLQFVEWQILIPYAETGGGGTHPTFW